MWDKAKSLAARHLKPAFVNLKIVNTEDRQTNTPEVSEPGAEDTRIDLMALFAPFVELDR